MVKELSMTITTRVENMSRYYVEFKDTTQTNGTAYLYVKAYSVNQIRDMFDEYDIVAIDITE
jgi:hypothetical protein